MRDHLIDELHYQATILRAAIEATNRREFGDNLRDFPVNCCHHAVKLLAIHLSNMGWGDFQASEGSRNASTNAQHVWLIVGEILIDLTADQFAGEGQLPVIVTRRSPWHDTWNPILQPIEGNHLARWRSMADPNHQGYREIMTALTDAADDKLRYPKV